MALEISVIINNYKQNNPLIFSAIIFFIGTIFGVIITHYAENTLWDTEPPYIINMDPSTNTYLNEIPEAIIVNFVENGGSGIDEDNSKINLTGAKSGLINGKIIFTKDTMSFKPETELRPDEYTVKIQIADRANPPQERTSKFYIYSKPTLTIQGAKLFEEIEKAYLNTTIHDIEWKESYDLYNFNIVNNNEIAIKNVNFELTLTGVVIKSVPFYKKFTQNYKFKLGKTSYYSPGRKIDSCSLRIEIDYIAPGGVFNANIITDSNISNYTYVEWCIPENDTKYAIKNGIYGGYQGSYDYIEYGLEKPSKLISDNILGEKAIRK